MVSQTASECSHINFYVCFDWINKSMVSEIQFAPETMEQQISNIEARRQSPSLGPKYHVKDRIGANFAHKPVYDFNSTKMNVTSLILNIDTLCFALWEAHEGSCGKESMASVDENSTISLMEHII